MRHRMQHGQNLVETAILLPILFLILAGVLDLGRSFKFYNVLANSTRVGAREASRAPCYPSDAAQRVVYRTRIISAILAEANSDPQVGLAAGDITITPDPVSAGCAAIGGPLRVTITYSLPTFIGDLFGVKILTLNPYTEMAVYGRDLASP
jgi:Flp pilus assembly protein TadG